MTASRALLTLIVLSVVAATAAAGLANTGGASAVPAGAPEGRWRPIASDGASTTGEMTEEQRREIERLRSIGYLTGSRPASLATGVLVNDAARVSPGLNVYTSGHFPGAILMDANGTVLHRWERSFIDVWPDRRTESVSENAQYWRYVHVFENGDVLAIFEGLGLVKLDRDSEVIWASARGEHHDLKVLDDGTICVLAREVAVDPRFNPEHPVMEDFVLLLTPDGKEIRRISILEALGHSPYAPILGAVRPQGDVLHTNAVEVLRGGRVGHPAFRAGNVLVSMRTLSALAVIDMSTARVTWALKGSWRRQHDPSVLPDGRILIFDNVGNDDYSRVVEIDPDSSEIEVVYQGYPADAFYSQMCGAAARLPNGNTLATESDAGRALEIAPGGEVVWEYMNPEVAGEDGQLVATLFEMVRLRPDFPTGWVGSD